MWANFKRLFASDPDKMQMTNEIMEYFDKSMKSLNIINKTLIPPTEPVLPTMISEP